MIQHINLMARYNTRMNRQIYQSASHLSPTELNEDKGAFFTSIMGTLNHILVGDLIWLRRLATHTPRYTALNKLEQFPKPSTLSHIIFPSYEDLEQARFRLDQIIEEWCHQISESDITKNLKYSNTKGIASERNFGELVLHLFNHQTHHRGQISTLLFQAGEDIGITDFLLDIPDLLSQ